MCILIKIESSFQGKHEKAETFGFPFEVDMLK